jgi:hypothetical protein
MKRQQIGNIRLVFNDDDFMSHASSFSRRECGTKPASRIEYTHYVTELLQTNEILVTLQELSTAC